MLWFSWTSDTHEDTAIEEAKVLAPTLRSDRVMRPLSRLLDVRCSDPGPAFPPRSTAGSAAAAAASVASTALAASSPFRTSALKAALYVGDLPEGTNIYRVLLEQQLRKHHQPDSHSVRSRSRC